MNFSQKQPNFKSAYRSGMVSGYQETHMAQIAKGEVFFQLEREGQILDEGYIPNVVTLDASLLAARLFKDNKEPRFGMYMLAIGTGALGSVLNPNAPSAEQRRLNNEIFRKTFSETTHRDENGAASAIPTRVVDFSVVFGQGEAVGPLNEMGLISPISGNNLITNPNPNFAGQGGQPYDPSIDVTKYDILCNYLTFPVKSKGINDILSITWRLTF